MLRGIDSVWFNVLGEPALLHEINTVGVVLAESLDTDGNLIGHKAYIGVGYGRNIEADIQNILGSGSRYPERYAAAIWPNVTDWLA